MSNEVWEVIRSTLGTEIADAAWDIAFDEGWADSENANNEAAKSTCTNVMTLRPTEVKKIIVERHDNFTSEDETQTDKVNGQSVQKSRVFKFTPSGQFFAVKWREDHDGTITFATTRDGSVSLHEVKRTWHEIK